MQKDVALFVIKTAHTLVWIVFVLCIFAIPVMSWLGKDGMAAAFIVIVSIEVAILAVNNWHCPLTPLAARFTDSKAANFDIFLPAWLARYNKQVFGSIYAAATVYAFAKWLGWDPK